MIADNLDIGRTANAEIILAARSAAIPRLMALADALCQALLAAKGITNKSLSARTRLSPIP
jgi:hypothetical protein